MNYSFISISSLTLRMFSDKEGGGGHQTAFVEDLPKQYECPICLMAMREPHIVNCCGQKYCKTCIEQVGKDDKPCPVCSQTFTTMIERALEREILGLNVYCEKREEGCKWIGELKQLKNHLDKDCPHVTVECPLGCGLEMKREALDMHRHDVCRKRSVQDQLYSITSRLEARLVVLEDTCSRQHEDIEKQRDVITQQEEQLTKQQEGMEKMVKIIEEQRDSILSLQEICRKQENEISKNAQEFQEALKHQEENLRNIHSNKILPRFAVCLNALHEYWYSPPFYSHPCGYKLCFRVKTSTPHFTNHYNVSCEAFLVPGECDEDLHWPVDINIMVEVFCHQTHGTITGIYEIIKAEKPQANRDAAKSKKQELMQNIKHSRPIVKLDRAHYILYSADIAVMGVDIQTHSKQ